MTILWILLMFMMSLFFTFFAAKSRFLTALLLLESLVLLGLVFAVFFLWIETLDLWVFLLLLTFGVCEACLGLSLLLTFLKISSSDYISYPSNIL
uniref:NADH dehydrogenase subunit 4L n=1 Tax=Mundiphaedusa decapitata TaxID=145425 RepID=A0A224A1G7_9EUPU|nr:NADH dehydrogenase subunit 4L [Mundiphaedusa decapitata]